MISETIRNAWSTREGPIVLTTVDTSGVPNAIYASCVFMHDNSAFVVADNYFNKTRANIATGSKGSLLFITKERKSFQVKGTFEYLSSGPLFDEMKRVNPPQHPGVAAAILRVEQSYSGGTQLS